MKNHKHWSGREDTQHNMDNKLQRILYNRRLSPRRESLDRTYSALESSFTSEIHSLIDQLFLSSQQHMIVSFSDLLLTHVCVHSLYCLQTPALPCISLPCLKTELKKESKLSKRCEIRHPCVRTRARIHVWHNWMELNSFLRLAGPDGLLVGAGSSWLYWELSEASLSKASRVRVRQQEGKLNSLWSGTKSRQVFWDILAYHRE